MMVVSCKCLCEFVERFEYSMRRREFKLGESLADVFKPLPYTPRPFCGGHVHELFLPVEGSRQGKNGLLILAGQGLPVLIALLATRDLQPTRIHMSSRIESMASTNTSLIFYFAIPYHIVRALDQKSARLSTRDKSDP